MTEEKDCLLELKAKMVGEPVGGDGVGMVENLDECCAAIDSVIDDRMKQLSCPEDCREALIFVYVTGEREVPDGQQ